MAITKLMHMKSSKGGSPSSHLKNAIDYILQDKKVARTDTGIQYKASQNCFIDHAYRQMMDTKEQYGKTDGRQGYHFAISFRPGEVTREQLWSITEDFVRDYLPGYEAVYAIHDDQKHLHSHIVFNSVNSVTGLKYHYRNGDWERTIQPMVDHLCMKYGAPVLEYHIDEYDEDGIRKEYRQYSSNFNWTREIKTDIDDCIQASYGWEDFVRHMKERGYTFNYGKYISIRRSGMQRSRRLKENTLGPAYTPEGIIERIQIQNHDYRMHSVGIITTGTGHLPSYKKKKKSFKRYADMDFGEKAMVKHMLRIRNAIPEYRITPGNWYVERKVAELHRTERMLLIMREYNIRSPDDMEGISRALNSINEKKAALKQEENRKDVRMDAWEDIIRAYSTVREIQDSYGLAAGDIPAENAENRLLSGGELTPEDTSRLKESMETIRASGESMDSISGFLLRMQRNGKVISGERKELDIHRRMLLSMKKKVEEKHSPEKETGRKQAVTTGTWGIKKPNKTKRSEN